MSTAFQSGGQDDNRAFILRPGTVTTDNVSAVTGGVGDGGLGDWPGEVPPNTSEFGTYTHDDDVKSRDSDNPIGDNGIKDLRLRKMLLYKSLSVPFATGVALDGRHIAGESAASHQLYGPATGSAATEDEATNDSRSDGGEWFSMRSGTVTNENYDAPTG